MSAETVPFFLPPLNLHGQWPKGLPAFKFRLAKFFSPSAQVLQLQFRADSTGATPVRVHIKASVAGTGLPRTILLQGALSSQSPTFQFTSPAPASGVVLTLTLVDEFGFPAKVVDYPTFTDFLISVVQPGAKCPEGYGGSSGEACCALGTSSDSSLLCSGHGQCGRLPKDTSPAPGACACDQGWSGPACATSTGVPSGPSPQPRPDPSPPSGSCGGVQCSPRTFLHATGNCDDDGECQCYVPWSKDGVGACEDCGCLHGGMCNWTSQWQCACLPGWTGALCAQSAGGGGGHSDPNSDNNNNNGAGNAWVVAIVCGFLSILVIVVYLGCCRRRGERRQEKGRGGAFASVTGFAGGFSRRESLRRLLRSNTDDVEDSKHQHLGYIIDADALVLHERVGGGGHGVVRRAVFQGVPAAAKEFYKMLDLVHDEEDAQDSVFREAETLMSLHHPNIVQFFGLCIKDSRSMYLVMELASHGTLADAIETAADNWTRAAATAAVDASQETAGAENAAAADINLFRPPHFEVWARGIAAAVAYLHSRGMLHRDLKPANVLLCSGSPPVCKLCDFGISKRTRQTKKKKKKNTGNGDGAATLRHNVQDADTASELSSRMSSTSHLEMTQRASFNNIGDLSYAPGGGGGGGGGKSSTSGGADALMTLNVGTLSYMAPELRSDENYGRGVDVWSYGVMLIALFTLRSPTSKDAHEPGVARIIAPRVWEKVPPHVARVIQCCLREDTNRRPTFDKICKMLTLGATAAGRGSSGRDL